MPKGYWIAHVDVRDPEIYQQYVQANALAFAKYGARFLTRGGKHVVASGRRRRAMSSLSSATTRPLACHDSPEYREAAKLRDAGAAVDLVIVEGYDGPQPG